MSRILFLTQVLPYPLDAGPKVRAYHMLRHLAERHEVSLVSFVRPTDTSEAIRHLGTICDSVHPVAIERSPWRNVRAGMKGLVTGRPMVVVRDEIAPMERRIRQLVNGIHFDVIHADQLSMAWYARLAASNSSSRTILDEHNAIYLLTRRIAEQETAWWRRALAMREAHAFVRYEAAMCQAFDAVMTVTAQDRDNLLSLFTPEDRRTMAGKFSVVPICVDPAGVAPVARQPGPPTIIHLGTMFWPPNVAGVLWFARQVLPLIHRHLPDARFVIVGKDPPPAIQSLASDPLIDVTGYVHDPTPHLCQADAFIVPLHAGSGMRVKILDAWLWGVPVVSTPVGAEGIDVRDGDNILIADGPSAYADATIRLLTDGDLNQRMRQRGRAWVEAHYSWQAVYPRVDEVYARLGDGSDHRGRVYEAND